MTPTEAIAILERHNIWRRTDVYMEDMKMEDPKELGIAIDIVIAGYRELLGKQNADS